MAEKNYLDDNGLLYFWQKIKGIFVQKDGSKVLSDNNYTTEEKNKLAGIQENANNYTLPAATKNNIGGVKAGAGVEILPDGTINVTGGGTADAVNWENVQNKPTDLAGYGITDAKIENKTITLGTKTVTVPTNNNELTNGAGYQTASDVDGKISTATEGLATEDYVNGKVSSVYKYKGSVANQGALPSSAELGDVYNLEDTGMNVAWNGTSWDPLGSTVDLSDYQKASELIAITNGEIDDIIAS